MGVKGLAAARATAPSLGCHLAGNRIVVHQLRWCSGARLPAWMADGVMMTNVMAANKGRDSGGGGGDGGGGDGGDADGIGDCVPDQDYYSLQ